MSNYIIILGVIIIIIVSIFLFISFKKEEFKNEKLEKKIKDFDKEVIDLNTLKQDKPKIKDFKPTKTSELDLFCKNNIDGTSSCYRQ